MADVLAMLDHLTAQVTALTTTVRALIETHPDRAAVDRVLARQRLRLEAVYAPTTLPDQTIATILAHIDDMRTIAQRDPEPPDA